MQYLPFHSLLYRYFFYGWLFRDANRGNRLEQAAALRHNCEQAHWLPTYVWRWVVLGALFFCVAAFCETILDSPQLSALFYVPSVLSMPINVVTAVCWLGLVAPRPGRLANLPAQSGDDARQRIIDSSLTRR